MWQPNKAPDRSFLNQPPDMQILVFKTNLSNSRHVKKVEPSLNLHPYIREWNVDLHDCDKILRVVTENIPPAEVENIVFNAGYFCEELK